MCKMVYEPFLLHVLLSDPIVINRVSPEPRPERIVECGSECLILHNNLVRET